MKRVFSSEENLLQRKKPKAEDRGNKSVFVQWYVIFLSKNSLFCDLFSSIDRSIDRLVATGKPCAVTGHHALMRTTLSFKQIAYNITK